MSDFNKTAPSGATSPVMASAPGHAPAATPAAPVVAPATPAAPVHDKPVETKKS